MRSDGAGDDSVFCGLCGKETSLVMIAKHLADEHDMDPEEIANAEVFDRTVAAPRPRGWIGVDLDATLAHYDGWKGEEHIGPPVPAMLARVKSWLAHGHPKYGDVDVKIMTARISDPRRVNVREVIERWCMEHIGQILPITNEKDYGMIELWDDRVVQVEPNTGRRMDNLPEGEGPP